MAKTMKIFDCKPVELLNAFERAFSVISLMLYMGAVVFLIIMQGASEGDGVDIFAFNYTPVNLLYMLNYALTLSFLFLRWPKVLIFLRKNLFFLVFILLAPLSYTWSAMPEKTLSGSFGLIGSMLFGLYLASRFSPKEQLRLISYSFFWVVVLSFIFIIAIPKYGIMGGTHAGTPRGVFDHKNGLGRNMVLSNTVFLLLSLNARSRPEKIFAWTGVMGSALLIVLSSSTAALINGTALAIAVLLLNRIIRLKPQLLIPFAVFATLLSWSVSVLAIDIATPILKMFGKDLTLTGRTDFWPAIIEKIQERPWLGYGFSGFWHGLDGESADVIRTARWNVIGSHNGFLDLMLALGLVGFIFFLLITWTTLVKSLSVAKFRTQPEYLWPVIFIIYIALANLSESTLMSQNNFYWIIFTTVTISTSYEFSTLQSNMSPNSGDKDSLEAVWRA